MANDERPPGGFTEQEWAAARPWTAYLASVSDKRDIWEANKTRLPDPDQLQIGMKLIIP